MSQINAREIAIRLAVDPERVARHLLGPAGKREGSELRYGDVGGAKGKSLGVNVGDERPGVWCDFSTGESGDLLDLWRMARNLDTPQAMAEAKAFLGIQDVKLAGKSPVVKALPRPAHIKPVGSGVVHWLKEERKLSPEVIAAYKVAESKGAVAFPFLLPDGTLAAIKYRALNEDKYWAEKDSGKVLFGWQAMLPDQRTVLLCEGELKAMAWWDYGFAALSVPFGGGEKGKQDWIENEFDRLSQFDVIYLALDEDEKGKMASDFIMARLGPERCAVVKLPLPAEPGAKCINACLRHGVSRAAVSAAVLSAKPRDPDELRSVVDYADEVAAMYEDTGPENGIRTPWRKVGESLVFRPGEVTVIAGINGHGKSQAVGFMAGSAMVNNARVCVVSLEFRVGMWLKRLVRQMLAIPDPTPKRVKEAMEWMGDGRLWAFDAQGTTDWRRMLDVFRYARRRYGVDLFVIDNMTGLGISEEDYQGQKALVLALTNFARDENTHVWLVHHIRKTNGEHEQPDKMDIKGSGAITDLASTVLTVWRNKGKEDKAKRAMMDKKPLDEETVNEPDVRIKCSKQRNYSGNGNGEPSIGLWWDGGTYHYLSAPDHTPRPLVRLG